MKKVLLASTALVAFSGAAVADVALSGRAEMGIFDNTNESAQFFTDIDVTFTMSGETDSGLTFGASVDLDEGGNASVGPAVDVDVDGINDGNGAIPNRATNNNTDDGGVTIFVSGSFGTVTLGDTDGALDWALTEAGNIGNPGSIADNETGHAGYVGFFLDGGNDGQILRYDNSFGDVSFAVSVEDNNGGDGEIGYAVGVRYNLDLGGTTVALGLGHQEAASAVAGVDVSATGVSATANFTNGLSAGFVYADFDDGNPAAVGPDSNYGIGIGYATGAFSIHANYGEIELDNGANVDGFGVSAAYDLGGGAVAHFGYGDDDFNSTYSLGLGLSF